MYRKFIGLPPGILFEKVVGTADDSPKPMLKGLQDGTLIHLFQRFIEDHCVIFKGQISAHDPHSVFQQQMKEIGHILIIIRRVIVGGKVFYTGIQLKV